MTSHLYRNVLLALGLIFTSACEGNKSKKTNDNAAQQTSTQTKTQTKTDTDKSSDLEENQEEEEPKTATKKLEGEFKLAVDGQFFGKTFTKKNYLHNFKSGTKDFPIIPENIKTISGVSSVTYTVSGDDLKINLNREAGKIILVMTVEWEDNDNFAASKKSCTNSGKDTLGTIACSQLTKLDISGVREPDPEAGPAAKSSED